MRHQLDLALVQAIAADLDQYRDDEQTFLDTLNGETDAIDVLERLVSHAQQADAMADAIKAREADLRARRARYEAQHDRARAAVRAIMEAIGQPKVTLPIATVSLSAPKPALEITAPDDIPTQLCRIKREPDKTAIRKALLDGETIPGAALTMGQPTLTIRGA